MPARKKRRGKPVKKRGEAKVQLQPPSILEHELVPKHRILSPEEAEEVLRKYSVTPQQLPRILASDPVVKEIGAKPGDIIEIIRDSETAGKTVYYRVVVKGEYVGGSGKRVKI